MSASSRFVAQTDISERQQEQPPHDRQPEQILHGHSLTESVGAIAAETVIAAATAITNLILSSP